ncbi:MAG: DUF2339 domain-containing protein [Acidimicrobiia bacterium]|nr:DUF2339 domain-containing protein [Acidimicrobiia bacterium]
MSAMESPGTPPADEPDQRIETLTRRVAELERRLAALERPAASSQPWTPPAATQPLPPPPPTPPPPVGRPFPVPPPAAVPGRRIPGAPPVHVAYRSPISSETFLKWAGLGLVVLAAIFLVATAIDRGWIGPELQLLGATIMGFGLLAGAFRLAPDNRPWSEALAAGGAIVLPVCAMAANAALELWPNGPALVVLAAVTVGLAVVAYLLDQQAVLAIAATGAAVGPLWIGDEPPLSVFVVAGWLAALTIAAISAALVRPWTVARLVITVVTTATILAVAVDQGGDLDRAERAIALSLLVVVAAVTWAAPAMASIIGTAASGWLHALDHRFVLYLPTWVWATAVAVVDPSTDRSVGAIGLVVVIAFTIAVLAGWTVLNRELTLSHLLGVGILLTISLSFVLTDAAVVLLAIAAQAAATAVLAWRFGDRLLVAQAAVLGAVSWLWAVGVMLVGLFESLSAAQHLADAVVVVLVAAAVAAVAIVATDPAIRAGMTRFLAVLAWIGGLLWVGSVFSQAPQGQVIISAVWAAAAAVALVVGIRAGEPLLRVLGLSTLVVVLAKLLTVDLANIDTLWRVGLFFVIGAGLLRLGYLLPSLSAEFDARSESGDGGATAGRSQPPPAPDAPPPAPDAPPPAPDAPPPAPA